jgi:hypothetical protein
MGTLLVEMTDVVVKDSFEMATSQNEQPVEAFGANRPDPAFRVGVGPEATGRAS